MKKTILKTAVAAVLSASVVAPAQAGVASFDWDGVFTMLTSDGHALAFGDGGGSKVGNKFQTPITGTMQFDTVSGAGTATMEPFTLADNSPGGDFEAVSIKLQSIGNGMGGSGTLILGNMLFNWSGNNRIPVSLVLDAAGFFAGAVNGDFDDGVLNQADVAAYGVIPASDGTYVGSFPEIVPVTVDGKTYPGTVDGPFGFPGYLGLGPVPIATTAWNTSFGAGCSVGDCQNVSPSGVLPLVMDTAANAADFIANDGGAIGGSPMSDGPFQGSNVNLDILTVTATGFDANASIAKNCDFDPSGNLCGIPLGPVPVPAAVWLFGSGLLGLIGVARRKKFDA